MAESVKVLPPEIQKIINVQKWDMRTLEGVQRFKELKADGELVYQSIIPMQEELIEEIFRRHKEKNQLA
ncbi:MAG: hypothetical protein JRF27_09330 [Deltaproteobacteria bacterium]|nr:hypothetical protein [Deltaproteobacteria bacterium]